MNSLTRANLRRQLEASPWLIMAAIVGGSFWLAVLLVRIDLAVAIDPAPSQPWLYGGTVDSAISLLSAVASSAITVAGVVFSATLVTMQLASSQYTPRVIEPLSRRWYIQIVLGVFLGNFMYSVVVLRSARPATNDEPEFVPVISVTVCVIYALASVCLLLYYTSYAMRALQPSFLIDSAARETVEVLRRRIARARHLPAVTQAITLETRPDEPQFVTGVTPGFVQQVRVHELTKIAQRADLVVRVEREFGTYVLRGEPLLAVWPAERCTNEVEHALRETVVLGPERLAEQDIEYGIRRVADILLKALSPAINDPTTAEYALNRLCELIVLLASSVDLPTALPDDQGIVRIVWQSERFDRCVRTAFGQLRFYIGTDTQLMLYSLDLLHRTATWCRPPCEDRSCRRQTSSGRRSWSRSRIRQTARTWRPRVPGSIGSPPHPRPTSTKIPSSFRSRNRRSIAAKAIQIPGTGMACAIPVPGCSRRAS